MVIATASILTLSTVLPVFCASAIAERIATLALAGG
jgi:hypothetical protein